MNTTKTVKTVLASLAAAAAFGIISAPAASATDISTLLESCRINDREEVQQLAIDLTLDEGAVLDMINNFRFENGVDPVTFDRDVTEAAVIATHDSAVRGFTPSDHVDSLGRGPGERLDACGTGYNAWGEIAYEGWGQEVSQSGALAFDWWINSETHREIMLDPQYTKVGLALGYIGEIGDVRETNRTHWTAVFTR